MTQAHSILDQRRAGILLHITSLPGSADHGDLGPDAYRFVDFLVDCGVTVWQTLPINPTHLDGSPYQCLSAHAGNPLMINLQWLVDHGLLRQDDLHRAGDASSRSHRLDCLKLAFQAYRQRGGSELRSACLEFSSQQQEWLHDYALFMALREEFAGCSWQDWPEPLRDRQPIALAAARERLAESIERIGFEQFVFFRQWMGLREYANRRGVLLFGDIPIFVANDSSDVWANQACFDLKEDGRLRVVAGVPPDYFSASGQRWGNPHYRWDRMQADGFKWWLNRFHNQLALYDWVRIDHFRGFEAYWEIPAESETAMEGHWVKAPGHELLSALYGSVAGGRLPLVAENLGIITPEVESLRTAFDIPGMLILHFAFDGGPGNPYLPHNHTANNVVYTGTHDNDTTLSWFNGLGADQQRHVLDYLGHPSAGIVGALVKWALASVARLAILPMQDVLALGEGNRMNTPGTTEGNWNWRFGWDQVTDERVSVLRHDIAMYGRR